ncbi:hypothetical protein ACEN8K_47095, partial [Variovorax sp. CT11-76]
DSTLILYASGCGWKINSVKVVKCAYFQCKHFQNSTAVLSKWAACWPRQVIFHPEHQECL